MANTYSAGIATAYGAAVRGGYTGTYEQFCAQQAEYASNAQAVELAKAAAQQAAANASTSEGNAYTSASAAAASATAAGTSATNAGTSATSANDSAVAASSSATAAGTSATNAGNSATAAGNSATAAANSATAAAASAADAAGVVLVQASEPVETGNKVWFDSDSVEETSVPTMAEFNAQSEEIATLGTGLNTAFTNVNELLYKGEYTLSEYIQGYYTNPTTINTRADRVATKILKLYKGDKVFVTASTHGIESLLDHCAVNSTTFTHYPSTFTSESFQYEVTEDSFVTVWFRPASGNLSPSDIDISVVVEGYTEDTKRLDALDVGVNSLERNAYHFPVALENLLQGYYTNPTTLNPRADRVSTTILPLWRRTVITVGASVSGEIETMIFYWEKDALSAKHYPDDFTLSSYDFMIPYDAETFVCFRKHGESTSGIPISVEDVDVTITTTSKNDKTAQWVGKKLLCVGDSITNIGKWVDTLAANLGMTVYNRGVSGTSITTVTGGTNSFCQRADLTPSDGATHSSGFPTSADLVIVFGGANDWGLYNNTIPFGNETDAIETTNFCGALHYLMRSLKTKYPTATIIFVECYRIYSPQGTDFVNWSEISYNNASDETDGFTYRTNSSGKTFDNMRQAIRDIANMYGVKTVSLLDIGFSFWNSADRNVYSLEQSFSGVDIHDGLHPSDAGSELIARKLFDFISEIGK